jgi:hypothetical protein
VPFAENPKTAPIPATAVNGRGMIKIFPDIEEACTRFRSSGKSSMNFAHSHGRINIAASDNFPQRRIPTKRSNRKTTIFCGHGQYSLGQI